MNESQKCPGYDRVLERNMGDGTASYHFDCPEEKASKVVTLAAAKATLSIGI